METQQRSERRKNRKKSRRRKILLILLVIFILIAGYVFYEYWDGKRQAEKVGAQDNELNQEYMESFEGVEEAEGITNVLLLGADSDEYGNPRTDTIMMAQYDVDREKVKLISFMRDSYVEIPGMGFNKLNASFARGGPELVRQAISHNFGMDAQYYAIVDFEGFTRIVDTISPGGVEIDVEKRMQYTDKKAGLNIDLEPGQQKLDGEQLLHYVRFRSDNENDFGRVRRQQKVLSVLKDEAMSFTGIMNLPRAVGTLEPFVNTNMKTKKILSLAYEFITNKPGEIETFRIPADGMYSDVRYSHAGIVLELDFEANRQALQEFLNE
ncbi:MULTISPECIES: LCP family protein [Allobacillus]|uniref:Regulatory protein MsrR n=1 Tax=Allobacillus salarius TaxID=1955272 RepID=A0A556PMU4_9BACI|nr:LCP family protein [Allobacillus salarius]TSJ65669.1 LytR family transcriptional regulator [Allobacillus salarius]